MERDEVDLPTLTAAVEAHLRDLAFLKSSFSAVVTRREEAASRFAAGGGRVSFGARGIDQVEFAFAPNPGEPARPLQKIASGGELSRVQLALAAALAQDANEALLEIDIIREIVGQAEAQVGDLRTTGACVEKDPDESRISDTGVGLVGFAYADQRLEFGVAHDSRGRFGQARWLHSGHRRLLDQTFVEDPAEEGLAAPVAVMSCAGLEPIELIGHELLNASAISER